jgi:glycosyltransferase involved in cell wall biosynthesis
MSSKRLLVVISDRLSDLVRKGEITARYYNPGNLFEEVHILMTNDDRPEASLIQRMVGSATLYLHNLPAGRELFLRSLGWQPWLLRGWVDKGVELATQIKPDLVRTYGNYLNGYLAAQIKHRLAVPLVVSLHTNPDEGLRKRTPWLPNWRERMLYQRLVPLEVATLTAADWVLPVYEPIRGYATRRGAKRIEICYNVLNPENLRRKDSYELHQPIRVISVGRQFQGKNPANLIRAVARLAEVELTLIGDGVYHNSLRRLASECGIEDRVSFQKSVGNDELCRQLPHYDIFSIHSEYWEVPKTVLEAMLTGLPVVVNRRKGEPVPELQGDWVWMVEDTPDGYYQALKNLLENKPLREQLGQRAYAHAQERWGPEQTERRIRDIHKQAMAVLDA